MVVAMLAPPDSTTLALPTLAATEALAARLAPLLQRGDVVLLQGPLGAGKTAFARALLRALTGDPTLDVPSPSFTLVQTYDTPAGPVHHCDLWRIDRADDLAELGLEEALRDIALIEWPEHLGETPPEALTIALSIGTDDTRYASLSEPPQRLAGLAIA